jgi:formylglycine-generating enzyme
VTSGSTFAPTVPNKSPPPTNALEGMVWISGGEFSMVCTLPSESVCTMATMNAVKDAQPIHRVYVDGFRMDKTDVTNEEFARSVVATVYVTTAKRPPTKEQYPTVPPENLVAGSPVFTSPPKPVPLDDYFRWWSYVSGADWRHPTGPESDLKGREKYPVVQVPTVTRRLTQNGQARGCLPRRNGNLLRVADLPAKRTRGATN